MLETAAAYSSGGWVGALLVNVLALAFLITMFWLMSRKD